MFLTDTVRKIDLNCTTKVSTSFLHELYKTLDQLVRDKCFWRFDFRGSQYILQGEYILKVYVNGSTQYKRKTAYRNVPYIDRFFIQ